MSWLGSLAEDARVGIAASVVGLVVVNAHPVWVPWTSGFVTDAFAGVVLAADLGLAVHLLGWIAVLRLRPDARWRRVVAPVFVASSLWPVWVFHDAFPVDLAAVGLGAADGAARFALGVVVLAVGLALVVTLVRAGGAALELGSPLGAEEAPAPGDRAPDADADEPAGPRRPTAQRPPPPRSRRHR